MSFNLMKESTPRPPLAALVKIGCLIATVSLGACLKGDDWPNLADPIFTGVSPAPEGLDKAKISLSPAPISQSRPATMAGNAAALPNEQEVKALLADITEWMARLKALGQQEPGPKTFLERQIMFSRIDQAYIALKRVKRLDDTRLDAEALALLDVAASLLATRDTQLMDQPN